MSVKEQAIAILEFLQDKNLDNVARLEKYNQLKALIQNNEIEEINQPDANGNTLLHSMLTVGAQELFDRTTPVDNMVYTKDLTELLIQSGATIDLKAIQIAKKVPNHNHKIGNHTASVVLGLPSELLQLNEANMGDILNGVSTYSKALMILNRKIDLISDPVLKNTQISDLKTLLTNQIELNEKVKVSFSAAEYQSYMNHLAHQSDKNGRTLLHLVLWLGATSQIDVYGGPIDNMTITRDLVKQLIACGSKIDVMAIKIAKDVPGRNYNKSDHVAAGILGITVNQMNEMLESSAVKSISTTTDAYRNLINNNSTSHNTVIGHRYNLRLK